MEKSLDVTHLIRKYNVPGPRYTSYPTVPYWEKEDFSIPIWKKYVREIFLKSSKQVSLYIHLPFCEKLCTFCGCHKHITKRHEVEKSYIETLLKEWRLYVELFKGTPLVKEIHLGGGTPTFFSPEHLKILIEGITSIANISDNVQLSFEGHPNNTSKDHLKTLYKLGFRRLSLGIQDYNPLVQKTINRIQPFEQVKAVHQEAKAIGYTINHDLVFGLPKQTLKHVLESIQKTSELRPDRISFYSYAHVPWIKGLGQRGYDEQDLPKDEQKRVLYEEGKKELLSAGYKEIGMDHFALPHDLLYKSFKEAQLHRNFMGYTVPTAPLLIGLGVSAISDAELIFAQNTKSLKEYEDTIHSGELALFRGHRLTKEDTIVRGHILDLMCRFKTELKGDIDYLSIQNRLLPLMQDGLFKIEGNKLIVTEIGKVFIRNLCMCFDLRLHREKPETRIFSLII